MSKKGQKAEVGGQKAGIGHDVAGVTAVMVPAEVAAPVGVESGEITAVPIEFGGIVLPELPAAVEGYVPRHVDVQLDKEQGSKLARLLKGLDAENARLANGRRVINRVDAVRWLIEQIPGT